MEGDNSTGAWPGRGGNREDVGAWGTARQGHVMGMSMARAGTRDGEGVWKGAGVWERIDVWE